jgi:hypothetical protein
MSKPWLSEECMSGSRLGSSKLTRDKTQNTTTEHMLLFVFLSIHTTRIQLHTLVQAQAGSGRKPATA